MTKSKVKYVVGIKKVGIKKVETRVSSGYLYLYKKNRLKKLKIFIH